jgi:sulfur-oxidizing protein SoxX
METTNMSSRILATVGAFFCGALLATAAVAQAPAKEPPGKAHAFNRSKGNCLACHSMPTVPDAEQPGNSGPPLIAMSARFPDRKALRAKIWDATASNPYTLMPPMGKHRILTEEEIDQVVDFIYGL